MKRILQSHRHINQTISSKSKVMTTHFWIGLPYVGANSVFLHILVVALYNLYLNWSPAVTMKLSLVTGGYQPMHRGTALCSMRSELRIRRSSLLLFSRSYSTLNKVMKRILTVWIYLRNWTQFFNWKKGVTSRNAYSLLHGHTYIKYQNQSTFNYFFDHCIPPNQLCPR